MLVLFKVVYCSEINLKSEVKFRFVTFLERLKLFVVDSIIAYRIASLMETIFLLARVNDVGVMFISIN